MQNPLKCYAAPFDLLAFRFPLHEELVDNGEALAPNVLDGFFTSICFIQIFLQHVLFSLYKSGQQIQELRPRNILLFHSGDIFYYYYF